MLRIIFVKNLPLVTPKLVPKLIILIIYWNFGIFNISSVPISILTLKIIFYEIFTTCYAQFSPKIRNIQNLLKFGSFHISIVMILNLMSKIIFEKFLLPVRSNLVLKLEMLRIYFHLADLIFEICQSQFKCQKCFSETFTSY